MEYITLTWRCVDCKQPQDKPHLASCPQYAHKTTAAVEALRSIASILNHTGDYESLVERVRELENDRERLDWLERIGFSTIQNSRPNYPGVHSWVPEPGRWSWTAHRISSEYASCRQAIDAARASEAGDAISTEASDAR